MLRVALHHEVHEVQEAVLHLQRALLADVDAEPGPAVARRPRLQETWTTMLAGWSELSKRALSPASIFCEHFVLRKFDESWQTTRS